ncbi:MAG: hypothetical protein ACOYMG_20435, partial [Candidatus Methylumidiphilus sp.]
MSANTTQESNHPSDTEDNVLQLPEQEIAPEELAPEDPMLADFRLKVCQTGEKRKQLSAKAENPILRMIGEIANSADFVESQQTIYAYETGFMSLYRTLDRIIKLGNQIAETDYITVEKALSDIKKDIKGGLGFVNIGRPDLPAINEKYVNAFKADPCSKLVDFFYASAGPNTRAEYRKITSWCQRHNRHNFVQWISDEIVYDGTPTADNPSGLQKCGKGIKGALKFVRNVERKETTIVLAPDTAPIDYAKAICDEANTMTVIAKPDWVNEKENEKGEPANFMILASVKGDQLVIYDVIDSDKRTYEKAIKNRHSSPFAKAFDQGVVSREVILEQIKNISKLISAPELLIWQDKYMTYL